jgi:hypothetical protein
LDLGLVGDSRDRCCAGGEGWHLECGGEIRPGAVGFGLC